ncbi:MAG TPA: amino acid adenylation domain-containing protein [Thermoanaerobaculia bacterium]|nr:amino acid adenylation domain-containing protein [Thermoanaerobaculia bacterium]
MTNQRISADGLHSTLLDFERQARNRPEAIAVTCEADRISYGDLDGRAATLACRLVALGVGPETIVGLLAERSIDLIVGLLAILKAGGAYLPLDPAAPVERLRLMAEECRCPVLVTQSRFAGLLPGFPSDRRILLDEDPGTGDASRRPLPPPLPESLAYVIFTSGSTGTPKGTLLTHRNLAGLFRAADARFDFGQEDVWTLFHSASFDFSVWEIWGALRYGGRLVIVPRETSRSPDLFLSLLRREAVTVLNQTPSAFGALMAVEADSGATRLTSLRWVILGGEALRVESLRPWLDRYPDEAPRLVNMYGITETTVMVTYRLIRRQDLATRAGSPIGVPLPGYLMEIRSESGEPVSPGAPGEIWVGGWGVARGYLGRDELTAARFVLPAGAGAAHGRFYRSGDLGRLLPDGEFEYLGRIDDQVKIRGFRVEPGEVEETLLRHPGVRACTVTARESVIAGNRLDAFWVAAKQPEPTPGDLRRFLLVTLPDYMVPSAFHLLPSLPLTPNGKVDRKSLREMAGVGESVEASSGSLRTPTEQAVARIFAELLEIPEVRADDDFFDLGGHSLLATQVVARLREACGISLPISAVFEEPTVSGLACSLEALSRSRTDSKTGLSWEALPEQADAPLSYSQERLWFLEQLHPGNLAYSSHSTISFDGPLDAELLRRSLSAMVARHEIYRTTFPSLRGTPVQRIHPPWEVPLPVVDVPDRSRLDAILEAETRRPFDFAEAPPVRWTLYRLSPLEHVLLHAEHHLVHDGWSFAVFLRELFEQYRALRRNEPPNLLPLPVRFAEFARAQRKWMEGGEASRQLAYWKSTLRGLPPLLELPSDRPRPPLQRFRGDLLRLELPRSLSERLAALGRTESATLFMTLLAGFAALLHRLTGEEDVSIGSGIAGRRWRESEGLLGMIINTVVLRMPVGSDPSFSEFLKRTRRVVLDAEDNQDVPFGQVVEAVSPGRSTSHAPLFQVLFSSWDDPSLQLKLPGLETSVALGLNPGSAKFDLNVVALIRHPAPESGGKRAIPFVSILWEYDTDLFDRETAEGWLARYVRLLEAAVSDPAERISRLPLLLPEEREKILALSKPDLPDRPPAGSSIPEAFARMAARFPDRTAVVSGNGSATYRELDLASNRLARFLVGEGVGREVPVGLCLDRSPLLIPSILGILKSGGAYLPLDPSEPASRNAYLLADSGARLVLADSKSPDGLPALSAVRVIAVDAMAGLLRNAPADPPDSSPLPDDLACVMYTSGTSGRPKGVEVLHRNILRLVSNVSWIRLDEDETFLQLSPPTFDASTFEIWGALLNGGRLVLYPDRRFDPALLAETLRRHRVSTLWLTASLFNRIVEDDPRILGGVRRLLTGGEALSVPHVRRAQEALPDTTFYNGYGPTEGTTFTTVCRIPGRLPDVRSVPIGRPVDRTRVYILDTAGQFVPPGLPGELHAGGDGIARGYRGREDLTAERFSEDPFSTGGRLYRTGDRARFLPDGRIEFLGRTDRQVKLRGYRVEPEEVEAVLGERDDILKAAVVPVPSPAGGIALAAYYVPRPGGASPSGEDLRSALRARLPEFMVPSFFVPLVELPITPNGKLDTGRLPPPAAADQGATAARETQSPLEVVVAGLFAEVLGRPEVGPDDRFFDLGGHSLLVPPLLARLREAFGVELPVRTFFSGPSARAVAREVMNRRNDDAPSGEAPGPFSIVPIRSGGSRPPFFLAPGGDGGEAPLLVYARLARYVDLAQPIYGMVWQPAAGGSRIPPPVEEMAGSFIREIRRIQPHDPYRIGGECVGGSLAWEIARQLDGTGDRVSLVLLDSRRPSVGLSVSVGARSFCVVLRRLLLKAVGTCYGQDPARPGTPSYRSYERLSRWIPIPESRAPVRASREWITYQWTLARYRPRPLASAVTLIASREERNADPSYGWRGLAPALRVVEVPGDHSGYLREFASETGATLSRELARFAARRPDASGAPVDATS